MTEALAASPDRVADATGRRLRIVVPALSYNPDYPSGSSRLAFDEAKFLAGLGHEVWLIAMHPGGGEPEHARDDGVNVLRYARPRFSAIDVTGSHQRAVRRMLLRRVPRPVDVVHAHMLLPGAAAFELYAREARTCYSLHSPVRAELLAAGGGEPLHERLRLRAAAVVRSRLEGRLLARCHLVTCDSDFTRRLVRQVHGASIADRMKVVPGWVDLSRFNIRHSPGEARQMLGWPVDRPVLFSLRRFVPRMGLQALVAAAARVRASGHRFHLVLAGEGPLRPDIEARVRALGLSDAASFPGVIPDERLPLAYGAADAFVLPTAALECFGLVVLEAMACGRPVLATPVGAVPELLGQVEPRWMAREASAEALASLISEFLDGRLPAGRPEALRGFVSRRYSMHDRVAELVRLALGEPEAA